MTTASLEQEFQRIKDTDPRTAAEYAYALARLHQEAGDDERAIRFGRESIALFDKCHMRTMEECAARNTVIGNVALPDLIHQEVVRARLQPLEL